MKQYTKKYGQVFLKDKNIGELETKLLGAEPGSRILEIGPGTGFLTSILLSHGYLVTAVESDHRFVELLESNFRSNVSDGSLKVLHDNFLETTLDSVEYEYIIGNIPYSISSPVLERLVELKFKRTVLMVQLEFAKRMVAPSGSEDYSRLSVFCSIFFNASLEKKVPKKLFSPVPGVDSAIVTLEKKIVESDLDWNCADTILKEMFSRKRKKIGSEYAGGLYADKRVDQLTPEQIKEIISYRCHCRQ